VPNPQQPDFRRLSTRQLSLVLAFTGCGNRFCQRQLHRGQLRHLGGEACELHDISKPTQAKAAVIIETRGKEA